MRWLIVALAVLSSAPARASIVRLTSTDEMVLGSPSIVVGVVRKVDHGRNGCTDRVTVEYDIERALRGPGGGKATYVQTRPILDVGCPSVFFNSYQCAVNWETLRAGERVIFYRGSASGDACDVASREAEITKLISKRTSVAELVDKVHKECHNRSCAYLTEIARHGDEAVPALREAILAAEGPDDGQTLVWAVGRIPGPASCALLEELLALGDRRVRANPVIEAMGSDGCTAELPALRKRFAAAAPRSYDAIVLLDALVALRDRHSTPLIARRMNEKAWSGMYLSLVLGLGEIGDKRAVEPLCARLARGGFADRYDRHATLKAITQLGGKCH